MVIIIITMLMLMMHDAIDNNVNADDDHYNVDD